MARNVVLLSVDALRADHLSCYGYDRNTTPKLDRFAGEAVLYENAFSASSHTRESLPALLTGQYPERAIDEHFNLNAPTIATHLNDTHSTAAFHSNPYVSRAYGFDRDFDKFYDDLRLGQNRYLALLQRALDKFVFNRGAYHARAEPINELSLSWLDSLDDDEPFFLWNHYMDVHGPYNPPEGFHEFSGKSLSDAEAQELYERACDGQKELSRSERELLVDLYDDEIRYVDAQIDGLLSTLKKRGQLEDTLVVVTSDHGDGFGENGYFAHPRRVDEELVHVPVLAREPHGAASRVETPVSTVDIVPTVLSAIGQRVVDLPGADLSAPPRDSGRAVYSMATGEDDETGTKITSLRDETFTLKIRWDLDTGKLLSESIQSTHREMNDTEEAHDRPDELRTQLREKFKKLTNSPAAEAEETPEAVEGRLEALGYK